MGEKDIKTDIAIVDKGTTGAGKWGKDLGGWPKVWYIFKIPTIRRVSLRANL
jgi:hypothetical protein